MSGFYKAREISSFTKFELLRSFTGKLAYNEQS